MPFKRTLEFMKANFEFVDDGTNVEDLYMFDNAANATPEVSITTLNASIATIPSFGFGIDDTASSWWSPRLVATDRLYTAAEL